MHSNIRQKNTNTIIAQYNECKDVRIAFLFRNLKVGKRWMSFRAQFAISTSEKPNQRPTMLAMYIKYSIIDKALSEVKILSGRNGTRTPKIAASSFPGTVNRNTS